jgi:hypothetical protein
VYNAYIKYDDSSMDIDILKIWIQYMNILDIQRIFNEE